MDNTQIDEEWYEIPRTNTNRLSISAVSNTGKYRRVDGSEGILDLRHKIVIEGKKILAYRLIAEHFLVTVRKPDQTLVDHVTHSPSEYNVNNVLNLRWCTVKENYHFDEALEHYDEANRRKRGKLKGVFVGYYWGEKSVVYKKNNVTPINEYHRAMKAFRRGLISEEELINARNKYNDYIRPIRQKKRAARKQLSRDSRDYFTT